MDNQISSMQDGTAMAPDDQGPDGQQMVDNFFGGIPNEDKVPQLHAITCRKLAILQSPDLLQYCNVDKESLLAEGSQSEYLLELFDDLNKAQEKLLAIFKLILKGDVVASQFLLLNLVSKVHSRSQAGMPLGQFNINISGLDSVQA